MRNFATVVKARPTDVDPEVFAILKHRLKCIRVYVGIETDADQGLRTLLVLAIAVALVVPVAWFVLVFFEAMGATSTYH